MVRYSSNLKKQIKQKNKEIKQEEDAKVKAQQAKVDAKSDKMIEKAEAQQKSARTTWNYVFGGTIRDVFIDGRIFRGILWFLQGFIEADIVFSVAMWFVTNQLYQMGEAIGHGAGITTDSNMIDKVNMMFIPTAFMALVCFAGLMVGAVLLWKFMNKIFGRLRIRSKFKHGLIDRDGNPIRRHLF